MAHTPRVFSGVQPTGQLTLGNYLGALKRFVELQGGGMETIYCVVDMHAITTWQEPAALREATRSVTAAFLACGLDPRRSIIFNQSQVAAHAELAWVFSCVVRLGWLNRMTQFKEKAGKDRENASGGLYMYPALMAADILVYKATHVPVGSGFAGRVAATHEPVVLNEVNEVSVLNPILREFGVQRLLGVPVLGKRGLLGVLHALPLAYAKDLQEDKEALFDAVDTIELELEGSPAGA